MDGENIVSAIPLDAGASIEERLCALFDVHHERLYLLARRLAPTTDDALDLVQETFLRAARSPESVPAGIANEEAWLVRVLVNIRRDQWRKMSVRKANPQDMRVQPDPETALIARNMVWGALDRLPPRRRAIVILHELEGMSTASIAALLGIRAMTVRWHLSKGRRDLAGILKPT